MAPSYSRTYDASPSFKWINASTIATGEAINVSWETYNPVAYKYVPFNLTRIINNGESDIWFYPNQDENNAFSIPKGTMTTFDRTIIPSISGFTIENAGTSTISANKIIVTNVREAQTADSIIQRVHKRLFGGGSGSVI